ncbi:LysR family transcriptional regulator [Acinetobacter modestus]|jgi:DNA-binding transcriptional LysR family regulator|uniref:LysR family transcriptional regulator n=1 Tax=Acinetobacter modestus TaxID=1776740 RepID=UPI00095E4CCF|nr:LysR family transcriptional regulator [Acinetobacter modestus]OJU82852.1 MAG: LysR family transcriptional regulator [Acinetobacter sp. 39-4]OJU98830.1 MAG: LysR family transcriptional regulator [Acinetobacter sp. 38-8]MCH7334749.1 LysR family transcriptional regulator [Acinetobacter modestus]MCH7388774.1 LysR family transcriptional regulator [Acinetobacter modestus]MCM1960972.1 LysR family transcriptional regulator [Acinetobacter modestus]
MNQIHNTSPLEVAHFHRIDINLYPLFIAIFEQKSISKAAQLLCISQSAVSHALQRLRTQLGDDLFVRSGQKMLPTPYAEQIYQPIQMALLSIQKIAMPQQDFMPSMLQSIKIAIHDEIEPIIFPQLVNHFAKQNLNIQFFSSKLDRKNMLADLSAQQIDFVIDLVQPYQAHLQFENLIEDYFVVCTQQTKMDLSLYLSSPHIGVSSRRTGLLLEDIYLNRQQLSRQIFLRCQHYSTALQVLAQHPNAILTIPQSILKHLHYSKDLQIHALPIELPKINMGMYWHEHVKHNARHQFLRAEILNVFHSGQATAVLP